MLASRVTPNAIRRKRSKVLRHAPHRTSQVRFENLLRRGNERRCGTPALRMRLSRRRFFEIAGILSLPLTAHADTDVFAHAREEMRWAGVPGASIALISATGTTTAQLGLRNIAQELPVTVDTIFEAGSTSKPLFSYAVLELVRAGKLDLHKPLDSYLPASYPIADPRGRSITAHHVLTHTSGLPNWRPRDTGPLALSFAPGTAYQYSGEGFYFLQTVVEQITGLSTAQFMRQTLDALGMRRSSYIWRDAFATDCAQPYGLRQQPLSPDTRLMGQELLAMGKAANDPFATWKTKRVLAALPHLKPPWAPVPHNAMPNAAWSLLTTAGEYAQFVRTLAAQPDHPMLQPQLKISDYVWRGLGIALQRQEGVTTAFFHTGSNPGFKAVMFGELRTGRGAVSMSNSDRGFPFEMHVVESALGQQPAVIYLEEP